ncbi:L-Ala-D/L-amino acid epimerase-like isoform X2 [Mercurialis annua]|nr:L-Ala-D/L-amino acid epimerase-like isoform X2 [Mercurialis annua]
MASIGSTFCPTTPVFFSSSSSNVEEKGQNFYLYPKNKSSKICIVASFSSSSKLLTQSTVSTSISTSTKTSSAERTSFGFKNLSETCWVDVQKAEGRPLNVELNAPLSIGLMSLEKLENVAIRVELSNGCVGWGEIAVLPCVDAVDQTVALAKAREACEFLSCSSPMTLSLVLDKVGGILPGTQFASVRAGVEMALIDAVANSIDLPLWRLFGGVSNTLTTAITVPTILPELSSKYCESGFKVLKFKIGKDVNAEIKALQAIQAAHPHCSFILDANESYTPKQAEGVLQKLHDSGIRPAVLEQPVHRDDWKGLAEVTNFARANYGQSIAVDQTCQTLIDVRRVIKENSADVINIKLAKFGVMGALEIIELARKSGIKLMISSTAETRLATGFAAHLAAGQGCFKYVVLDMPFLLSKDPVICGYEASGPVYKFLNARGQGGFLTWEFSS